MDYGPSVDPFHPGKHMRAFLMGVKLNCSDCIPLTALLPTPWRHSSSGVYDIPSHPVLVIFHCYQLSLEVWSSIPRIKTGQCLTWGVKFQCAQKPREEWPQPGHYFLPSTDEEPTVGKHILRRANNSLLPFKMDLNKNVLLFCPCLLPRPSLPFCQPVVHVYPYTAISVML